MAEHVGPFGRQLASEVDGLLDGVKRLFPKTGRRQEVRQVVEGRREVVAERVGSLGLQLSEEYRDLLNGVKRFLLAADLKQAD